MAALYACHRDGLARRVGQLKDVSDQTMTTPEPVSRRSADNSSKSVLPTVVIASPQDLS